MWKILISLIFCAPLISREIAPSGKQRMISLQNGIERIILNADPDVNLSIEIVSLKNGQRLYQKNGNHLLVPASCLKLLTSAAALHQLGVDYHFETKLLTDGRISNKTLKGNLYLQGSGDPEFAVCDLEELVFQLKLLGISKIEGDLFIDNTLFDPMSLGPGWMWDDKGKDWTAPIDALILNHSCIDLWVKPGDHVGAQPHIYQYPKNDFVLVENHLETTREENHFSIKRRGSGNVIDVVGKIRSDQEVKHYAVPVEDPHLFTGHVFQKIMTRAGIKMGNEIKVKAAPSRSTLLGTHSSRPLYLIVEQMMKTSDNLASDCLFKKLGEKRFGSPGTWQKGSQAVRDFLRQSVGLNIEKMVITDGCGLSRYNLVSAHQIVDMLKWMHGQFSCCSEFMAALPISGKDGTLKNRLNKPGIKGMVRAKTGSMTGVSTLAGYLTTEDGEQIAFCILQNGFTGPVAEYKSGIEDEICTFLVNFTRQ